MSVLTAPPVLSPWRDRRFRFFAAGNTVNNLGEAVYTVALPLLVFQLTGSLVVMSLLVALTPATLLLGPVLGTVVDRWGPRVLVVPGLVIQLAAAVALNLLGLAEHAPLWPLFVFGALVQVGGAMYRMGWMTGVASMFPDNAVRARGSLGSLYVVTNVVGPLFVALALTRVSYAGLLWLNVATFLAPILVWLAGVHPPRVAPPRRGTRFVGEMADGWRVLRERPLMLNATLVMLPMLLVGTAGTMTLAIFRLSDEWRISAQAVSGILVAVRIAMVVGTLAVSERRGFGYRGLVLVGTVGMGLSMLVMATGSLPLFVVGFVAAFAFQSALSVADDMMLIRYLPADALGRAGGILGLIQGAAVLAGPLLTPPISAVLGPSATFAVLGVLELTGLLWLARSWRAWHPSNSGGMS
ncbi:MFS transporter [Longispora sp. K20-0274]|uniref:MFS transporter n=1 Tax=Longispora sp. K20-0274 TaxID=3088255 RepID=UPI003999BDED